MKANKSGDSVLSPIKWESQRRLFKLLLRVWWMQGTWEATCNFILFNLIRSWQTLEKIIMLELTMIFWSVLFCWKFKKHASTLGVFSVVCSAKKVSDWKTPNQRRSYVRRNCKTKTGYHEINGNGTERPAHNILFLDVSMRPYI